MTECWRRRGDVYQCRTGAKRRTVPTSIAHTGRSFSAVTQVYLDAEVQAYLSARATARGVDIVQLVNELLRKDIELIEAARQRPVSDIKRRVPSRHLGTDP